jgi:hypothetical protein
LVTGTNSFEIKSHGQHLTFEFNKCRELFVGVRNKALSVVAMCVNNPVRPLESIAETLPPTPTGVYDTTGPGLHTQNDKLI